MTAVSSPSRRFVSANIPDTWHVSASAAASQPLGLDHTLRQRASEVGRRTCAQARELMGAMGGVVKWGAWGWVTRACLARGRARDTFVADARRRESQANFEHILRRIWKMMRNLITKNLKGIEISFAR